MQDNGNEGNSEKNTTNSDSISDLVNKAVAEATTKQAEEFRKILSEANNSKNEENIYQKQIEKVNNISDANKKIDNFTANMSFVRNQLPNMLRKFEDVVGNTIVDSIININNSRMNDGIKPEIIRNDTYNEFFNSIKKNTKYYDGLSSRIKNRIESGKLEEAFEDIVEYETHILEEKDSRNTMYRSPLSYMWDIIDKRNATTNRR